MKIDFTPEEAQFALDTLAQINIPLSNPDAPRLAILGNSVMTKLNDAILAEREKPQEKKEGWQGMERAPQYPAETVLLNGEATQPKEESATSEVAIPFVFR